MRLFVAIELEKTIREGLRAVVGRLQEAGASGNFTRGENLHLTLAFLGETDRTLEISQAMAAVRSDPFSLSISGLGRFKRRGGDLWWAGLAASKPLLAVQEQLSDHLRAAGFPLEKRPFTAHITLGREVRIAPERSREMLSMPLSLPPIEVTKLTLMRSHRVNGVLTYTPINRIELTP